MHTLGLISDIHANLPALEAVLADLDGRLRSGEVQSIVCLGDLVGYAPWPNEVVRRIRARGIPTIAGNYDVGVGSRSDDCGCAYRTEEDRARGSESIAYTNAVVDDDVREYLRGLPRHLRLTFAGDADGGQPLELVLVHGSPRRVNEYLFEDRPERSLLRLLVDAGTDVLAFGHTHLPYHRTLEASDAEGSSIILHAVNTGSVGKPKDGDPRAGYSVVSLDPSRSRADPAYCTVRQIRVEYDVERAAGAIEAGPLPDAFASMLRSGG